MCGSCIGSCCATCGCEALRSCCPSVKSQSKLPYLAVMSLSTILAIILRFKGGPFLVDLYIYNLELCTSDKCVGFGAVYRLSFALFVWFLFFGFMLTVATSCASIDRGNWLLKIFGYLCLVVLSWLIPNDFYEVYVHISRVVSGIFLFLQIMMLIDFVISWNEEWTKEGNEGMRKWLLVASFLFYAGSLTLMIFMFHWFGGDGCDTEKFFLAWTIITTAIFSVLSLWDKAGHRGGILPASVMCAYIHYVCYSALASDPSSCNTLNSTGTVQLIISLIIATASISYAAWNLATSNSLFGDAAPEDEVQKEVALNKEAASGALGSGRPASGSGGEKVEVMPASAKADEKDVEKGSSKAAEKDEGDSEADVAADVSNRTRNARFHFIMAAASMYMAMILTNWSTYKVGVEEEFQTSDFGEESMWIKIVSQWVTVIVYIWWLIAPVLCKDRDFS